MSKNTGKSQKTTSSNKRIEISITNTLEGNIPIVSDKASNDNGSSMTNAEHEAFNELIDVIGEINTEDYNSGDVIAEVIVSEDGDCEVDWNEAITQPN